MQGYYPGGTGERVPLTLGWLGLDTCVLPMWTREGAYEVVLGVTWTTYWLSTLLVCGSKKTNKVALPCSAFALIGFPIGRLSCRRKGGWLREGEMVDVKLPNERPFGIFCPCKNLLLFRSL